MNEWWKHPQKIKFWKKNIDYVMFVDENGSEGKLKYISKQIINNSSINLDDKFFTITGCIFNRKDYSKMRNNIRKLKNKYWNNGYYFDTKNQESRYVCLHSRDIRRHDGAFNDSVINYSLFINDLTTTLSSINCTIISVTIDLELYLKKGFRESIYEKAFDLLIERYIYATKSNKKGIIMLESRGKSNDKILLKHIYEVIYKRGQKNISTGEFKSKIHGVYFNPKWYDEHSSTFAGLEIADLFSYPIHQYIKYNEENPSFKVIKNKLSGYPDFQNKGVKIFPKEKDDKNHL